MYRIMRVKEGKGKAGEEETARAIKWNELICVMELLEDESESHKSRVLGKCESSQSHG